MKPQVNSSHTKSAQHHRRTIRLQGYDYSQCGFYFITICTQHRHCLFGKIIDNAMVLNDAGRMVEHWYHEIENKFPDIQCDTMIIMPNHIHFIVANIGHHKNPPVEADLCVCLSLSDKQAFKKEEKEKGEEYKHEYKYEHEHEHEYEDEHVGSPLHAVVQWFKTMTTNHYIRGVKQCNWVRFDGKLWQRNYYEHIIRDQRGYHNISNYIIRNPARWKTNDYTR